ncbi:unnamed protein product [Allacma fusca]|uniref:Major facilitator superfamily (MFS) profile domain-containing protein n=1 Tax=Allacma fusca TaxID=39272 RepID=A0A8J2KDV7_9HEXA|nr:unnamed protein product [Allacma fusca]
METTNRSADGRKLPQYIAALAACLGAFCLGTVLGWSSPAVPELRRDPAWGNLVPINGTDTGEKWPPAQWIGSLVALGALISGPIAGFSIDFFGRKTTMMILSAPFVLGWMLITFAPAHNLAMIYAGRFLTGFCGGAVSLAAPVYIGETAEDSIRGTLGTGFQLMVTIGILFTYIVGVALSWKWLSLVCGFGPVAFLIMLIFPPESPRWLISKGKHAEASEALRWLRGAKSSQQVEEELEGIQRGVDEGKQESSSFVDLLKPAVLKPTLICLGLMVFQQLSGINAVIFYTTDIFTDAGSSLSPSTCTIIVGVVQVVATVGSSLLMDRLGRKILLLFSEITMGIFLVALGVFFYTKATHPETAIGIGWLPLVSLIVFIIAFSMGFGPVPWLMMGELLPPNMKGPASALATSSNWILAFAVTLCFEDIKLAIGPEWCYWMFAIICAVGTAFVFIFVPETKGKSLDEIQEHFGAKHPPTTNFVKKAGDNTDC